ncbi:hypothetical protein [Bacteroides ovatus]|jgi:hypothetical protein|uniref:hypothetical protein n=1 Tax=Bacteroides ovatus TaxID=28116 RepID=UPI002069F34F|nr:hypothetical protein [Bacteroides ovatus]UYI64315.1 MAG: hypothetical protein OGM04_02545 [Bacteroides ovatus]DAU81523.1 MAG TPA: hypothetical protein [Caudoviricetes sp.]
MKNLLNPNIQFTDPDTLQFCLPLSDKEFWYCEPNCSHEKLLPESDSNERIVYDILCGYPEDLLQLSSIVAEVKEFISNGRLWCSGNISIDDIDVEEQLELLQAYGYSWDSFSSEAERNQVLCECYFETYCVTEF